MDQASAKGLRGTSRLIADPPELQPGARALLDAARELLMEGGFDALRIEAIARRAGVNKAMIRYYFGDKAGLVAALVDDLLHESTVNLVAASEAQPQGDERLHAYIAGTRRVMETPEFLAFFDVLAHALRDLELRRRIADLYIWYREMNLRCLEASERQSGSWGAPATEPSPASARHAAVASLMVAAVDGLAIQAALASEDIDLTACFAALEQAVGVLLADDGAAPPAYDPAVPPAACSRTRSQWRVTK